MKIFKKLLKIFAGLILTLLMLLIIAIGLFFFNPSLIVNPKNMDMALRKTKVLKSWSWQKAEMKHEWIHWNERRLTGDFSGFCFVYEKPTTKIDTCIEQLNWDVVLLWNSEKGFDHIISKPITIVSNRVDITTKEDPNDKSPPPDLMLYWKMLWGSMVPDIDVDLKNINIVNLDKKEKPLVLHLELDKRLAHLSARTMDFRIEATEKRIDVYGPKIIILPGDFKTKNPLAISELHLIALINESTIPVSLRARLASAKIDVKTVIQKSTLKEELGTPTFFQDVLVGVEGSLVIEKVNQTIKELMKKPFDILPAPFNALEGSLTFSVKGRKSDLKDHVLFNLVSELNMKGKTQALHLILGGEVPVNTTKKQVGAITLDLDLKKVALHLPELSNKKLPPQFVPDKRILNTKTIVAKQTAKLKSKPESKDTEKNDLNLKLQALGDKSLALKTNLLDEVLRITFDLDIKNGSLTDGYLEILPLKTTFFKRPIHVQSLRLQFNQLMETQLSSKILFNLPEYKITLKLEGPLSKPRQAFSSVPPLPLDDIYAVILFGRPLSNLEDEDRGNAQNAGQVLSKGILSLAILYYFAGSPVESIGYDPDAQLVSAQFGLGSKSSIRVTGEEGGLNSAGVRRSLGKGWYIDSSVQRAATNSQGEDFGVMLERIISY